MTRHTNTPYRTPNSKLGEKLECGGNIVFDITVDIVMKNITEEVVTNIAADMEKILQR